MHQRSHPHASLPAAATLALICILGATGPADAATPPPTEVTTTEAIDFDALQILREEDNPLDLSDKVRTARRAELDHLRQQVSDHPHDARLPQWLHRIGELEEWRAQVERALLLLKRDRISEERKQAAAWNARKRKRYEYKLALSKRRHWRLPDKPDYKPMPELPALEPLDLSAAIKALSRVATTHPRYRRMDQVLLHLGALRIEHGLPRRDIATVANGEQNLRQLLYDYGWSPLASMARIHLGDLALARGDVDGGLQMMEQLVEHEVKRPLLREYARYRLAHVALKRGKPAKAIRLLDQVIAGAGDKTLVRIASRDKAIIARAVAAKAEQPKGEETKSAGKGKRRKR